MSTAGSPSPKQPLPLWLLAELTYRCPLQCPYCSNPVDYTKFLTNELSTDEWLRVFNEARALGATQLGFSGGEPLNRNDIDILIKHAHSIGFYTNLITSGRGLNDARFSALKQAGLDSIQISIQDSVKDMSDHFAGAKSFDHKIAMAKLCKDYDFPLTLNFVIHRHNIGRVKEMLDLSLALEARYVELANTQYYGFALENRDQLLPSHAEVLQAEQIALAYKKKYLGQMEIFFVVPDYYSNRPKPCMSGWGHMFINIMPDGTALPCHSARIIPDVDFPSVRHHSLQWIWSTSDAFNKFRGFDWMKEPCKSCPERAIDFAGCRCQAYLLTGDAHNADPVCDLSPEHHIILDAVSRANSHRAHEQSLTMRNSKNSRRLTKK